MQCMQYTWIHAPCIEWRLTGSFHQLNLSLNSWRNLRAYLYIIHCKNKRVVLTTSWIISVSWSAFEQQKERKLLLITFSITTHRPNWQTLVACDQHFHVFISSSAVKGKSAYSALSNQLRTPVKSLDIGFGTQSNRNVYLQCNDRDISRLENSDILRNPSTQSRKDPFRLKQLTTETL